MTKLSTGPIGMGSRVIECHGSSYEIGRTHGFAARSRIEKGIEIYKALFLENVQLSWESANRCAETFLPAVERYAPHLLEEMRGIADGAKVPLIDIMTLNARSEIALTTSKKTSPPDGCTAFSKLVERNQWLAQNWDWKASQLKQIVVLRIATPQGLHLTTVTEAGIVAKVGMNERGVSVTLNALKTVQMDYTMLPIHLGLRLVLESVSVEQALAQSEKTGIASAAHFLLADSTTSIGVEVNPVQPFGVILPDMNHSIYHTNHCISPELPKGLTELKWLDDSPVRLARVERLVNETKRFDHASILNILKDESGSPNAINRSADERAGTGICTVFTIIMNCTRKHISISFGRPTEVIESLEFLYSSS